MKTPLSTRAAIVVNTRTDALLRQLGMNPGELRQANHDTTARMIESHAHATELYVRLAEIVDRAIACGGKNYIVPAYSIHEARRLIAQINKEDGQ